MINKNKHPFFCLTRYCFTLIEMLVVIAIIGILASMLMPSLQNAIETARRMACINNLKQIFVTLNFYSESYNGWGPGSNDTVRINDYRKWQDQCNYYLNPSLYIDRGYCDNLGNDYYAALGIFHCPSSPEKFDASSQGYDYGINQLMGANPTTTINNSIYYGGRILRRVMSPGKRAWIADIESPSRATNEATWNDTYLLDTNISRRHSSENSNILFVDGVASSFAFSNIPSGVNNTNNHFWGYKHNK